MSQLVESYGDFHYIYCGSGTLNGNECEFELGQKSDGTIRVCCISDELWPETNQFDLEGIVDSTCISASGKTIRTKSSATFSSESPNLSYYHYMSAGEFRVDLGDTSWLGAYSIRFEVVNFEFAGNEWINEAAGKERKALRFELDGTKFAFIPVEDYTAKIEALSARKGVEITCELEVEIGERSCDEIAQVVNAICSLLTIARGTKINWISYKLLDSDSELICHHCEPRITVPYTGVMLVKSIIIPKYTIDFLTQCFQTYQECNAKYHFDDVANFLVDIHSRGFLETRCLLLFSVAEVLTRKVCDSRNARKRLRAFVDEHDMPAVRCAQKKCGLDGETCEETCEVGMFVSDRRDFVHFMQFQEDELHIGYYRNLNFLHRMILSALNFRGDLYDWSKGGPVWR